MAMTVTKLRPMSFGNLNGALFRFTGDAGGTQYAQPVGVPLLGAILVGCSADPVQCELNVTDGSTASNGAIYWDTAIGSAATVDYILFW